jgi:probable addiction module antidote protein
MRLKNYKDDLLERLKDSKYAAAYLAQVLEDGDNAAFLIALKDVVDAGGGMSALAGHVDLKRPSLYKILSKKGNPTLTTLQDILKPLGLRVSITPCVPAA